MGNQGKHSDKTHGPSHAPAARAKTGRGGLRSWIATNRSDLRFLLLFGLCMGAYYLITLTAPIKTGFFPAYLRQSASASASLLRWIGEDVIARDQSIISADGPSVLVERGCDAVEPSALFAAAVLASPVPLMSRLAAAAVGTLLLMLLNLARIASLVLIRIHWPEAFETFHMDIWQGLFIFVAILLWGLWASRMARRLREKTDAST